MLEKTDPPHIIEGYGLSLSFLCLLDVVRSVQHLVETANEPQPHEDDDKDKEDQEGTDKGQHFIILMYLL